MIEDGANVDTDGIAAAHGKLSMTADVGEPAVKAGGELPVIRNLLRNERGRQRRREAQEAQGIQA